MRVEMPSESLLLPAANPSGFAFSWTMPPLAKIFWHMHPAGSVVLLQGRGGVNRYEPLMVDQGPMKCLDIPQDDTLCTVQHTLRLRKAHIIE
jgi:hypothetical protein